MNKEISVLKKVISSIKWRISCLFWDNAYLLYRPYVYFKSKQIKRKGKIKVLFVVAELGVWKTEQLYITMLRNPRFVPIIGLTTSLEAPGSKEPFTRYLNRWNFSYVDLDVSPKEINKINPDIIFYYKPYDGSFPKYINFKHHLSSLVCYVHYAFNQGKEAWAYNHQICKWAWQYYVENNLIADVRNKIKGLYNGNVYVTGLPVQDMLMSSKENFQDPWKRTSGKKRIIYAPHHSLKGTNPGGVEYGTFLEFGEIMLELAKKYSNQVQFAFKPHPTLYQKLLKIWGGERTEQYYVQWSSLPNCQIEEGDYMGLFKYSDAMIHDCSSFEVEYLYTGNPVLYLVFDKEKHNKHQNAFGEKAFYVHYHANSVEKIESFIIDVINGKDLMRSQREEFYNQFLIPPKGKTASDNIINSILGE